MKMYFFIFQKEVDSVDGLPHLVEAVEEAVSVVALEVELLLVVIDLQNMVKVVIMPKIVQHDVLIMENVVDVVKKDIWLEIVLKNKNVSAATRLLTCQKIAVKLLKNVSIPHGFCFAMDLTVCSVFPHSCFPHSVFPHSCFPHSGFPQFLFPPFRFPPIPFSPIPVSPNSCFPHSGFPQKELWKG